MTKYMISMRYSPGSWARMITSPGDRTKAMRRMMEALGGDLESMYWQFGTEDAVAIGELPDSVSASALHAAVIKTGAFKKVETHELLTQQQLLQFLDLARDTAEVFEVPGRQG
jgi:uncharacterized protein with GYD domain